MILEFFKFAYDGIRARKVRSWLTLLGIFIGVALVIALISLSQGLKESITGQFETLGTDLIMIEPGGGFLGGGLFGSPSVFGEKEIELVRGTRGVDAATGYVWTQSKVEFNGEVKYPSIIGIEPTDEAKKIFGAVYQDVFKGRFLKSSDGKKVLVGHALSTERGIFEDQIKVRDKIEIFGEKFQVVGILNAIGNPQDDNSLLMHIDTARELFDKGDTFDSLAATANKGADIDKVVEDIEETLRRHRHLDEGEEDFTISTSAQLLESFGDILNIVQLILVGIASISIVVGMVGIMNTMFTAVLQRTREIGVMKAIGARNSHILMIFLIESGIYGLIGGAIGIIAGLGFAKAVEIIAKPILGLGLFKVTASPTLIIATLIGTCLIGAISGIAPAIRASRLQPTEALRYE